MGGSMSFSMGGKAVLVNASQGKPYSNNAYPASNAFVAGGGKFTHTTKGVGSFWKASFKGGE